MDTLALQAFVEVAALASFSLAAEQLHITQPAVSKRIASLELQLDSKLFDRIGRTVSLTEAGHKLLPKASCRLLPKPSAALLNCRAKWAAHSALA